ncbi:hypothetical protein LTR37_020519 [Vermiconidia calcicola]|uniref:Uncharacterized protein n=1 Tax=Vermiconidia calcicola TaxID=1690605 RepID=A0ACC3MCH6_9PEZI|nr:hypothetical protein LTR37_020519 [Vermiconidia calcicola]
MVLKEGSQEEAVRTRYYGATCNERSGDVQQQPIYLSPSLLEVYEEQLYRNEYNGIAYDERSANVR